MYKSATLPGKENLMRPDNDDYTKLGYVPLREQYDNSVSHALEYYIADYSLYTLAKALDKKEDAKLFYKRSMGYKTIIARSMVPFVLSFLMENSILHSTLNKVRTSNQVQDSMKVMRGTTHTTFLTISRDLPN